MRRIAAAIALFAAAIAVVGDRAPGQALGPVVPITPFEVDTGGGFVGWIGDLDLAGRGQTAGVRDDEVRDIGFVAFDDGDLEPMVPGDGIGVSGDGCRAVVLEDGDGFTSLRVIDRCTGADGVVAELPFNVVEATINVTFDGRFAALHYRHLVPSITVTILNTVQRLDTETGELIAMPVPPDLPSVGGPDLHSDISDDGQFVVAPVTGFQRTAVAVWDVAAGASTAVVDAAIGRWAAFPSLSGDGAWIAFASNQPRNLGEVGRGPWVYVLARTTGDALRISPAEQPAYYTSISRDGTQVAFAVSNGVIPPPTTTTTTSPIILLTESPRGTDPVPTCPNPAQQGIWQLQQTCPPARIDVAFSSTPGLSAAQTETVSLDAGDQQTGEHWHPELSGNGRWVAWISNSGNSLIGQNADLDGLHHAYMRRRDAGLVVDDLTFPAVPVNTTTDAVTTVRNTGRTSVWLDEITTDAPDRFVVVGGSCALGMSLAPGTTCSVVVRFTPGPNPGSSSATLRVRETGHDPVGDVGALTGTVLPIDTTTSTTTTSTTTTTTVPDQPTVTTTTPPAQTTTTTRPATSTTRPGAPTLSATPNPVEFGSVAVGFASDPQSVTVRNDGAGGGLVQTSLGGAHPDDFWVRTNGCGGVTLAIGRDCQIEVLLIPTGGGVRTATLTIAAGTSAVDVTLRGNGTFAPRLVPMPAAVTEQGISTVFGQGFPPGESFTVTVVETGLTLQGTADATGLFRTYLATAGNLRLGTYTLHVDGVPDVFADVEAGLLVTLGTFRPQGAGGPAFGNSNLIVSRGG